MRDPLGRFVTGLDQSVFEIREDGMEQSITGIADWQDPAHLFPLIDTGVSPEPVIRPLLEERISTGSADDVVQIHGFGVLESDRSPITAVQTIQRRLTNLSGRKAAVIVTNSLTNTQRYTETELPTAPDSIDMPVYVIDLLGSNVPGAAVSGVASAQAFFRELASRTGGDYLVANSQLEVPGLVSKIEIAVRNMYVLSYMPRNAAPDGTYGQLEVSLKQPRGLPVLSAHYRPGYNAGTN